MKVSDLMIGDYVTVTPSGMLIKIAAVHHKKVAYHTCTNKLAWVRMPLLNPIPLTKEILEKNGFAYNRKNGALIAYAYESYSNQMEEISLYDVEIEYENNQLHICDSNHPREVMLHLMDCNYVHELQHALRVCKIDKEIVL